MINYQDTKQPFDLPNGAGLIEILPDGRILLVGNSKLWVEDSPGARGFHEVDAPAFGAPSFLRVSPSGNKAAAGNYSTGQVDFFKLPYVAGSQVKSVPLSSYDAEWYDETYLLVNGQATGGSQVSLIDTSDDSVKPIIVSIPGASGGISFDSDGNLYTGIGADGRPSTGLIKAYKFSEWDAEHRSGGSGLDFSTRGRDAANFLSAAFLSFDGDDNLTVGGGFGLDDNNQDDKGYAAIVSTGALRASLHDQPPIEPTTAQQVHQFQRLDPTPHVDQEFWVIVPNKVRKEVYLVKYGEQTVATFRQKLLRINQTANVQAGDNPGHYRGYHFVGMNYSAPFDLLETTSFTGNPSLSVHTKHVQSLGSARHQVSLNGIEVGRMTDGYFRESKEVFDFSIPSATYSQILAKGNPAELSIKVDSPHGAGLADDFVIERIEIAAIPV